MRTAEWTTNANFRMGHDEKRRQTESDGESKGPAPRVKSTITTKTGSDSSVNIVEYTCR